MIVIKREQQNNMVVSISQHKTLPNPSYLFSFTHILSKEKVQFYPENISTNNLRYDEFTFYEGEAPSGYTGSIPYIHFPYPGQYYYSVLEMFNTGTTNPLYAFEKLEEGRCVVEDLTIPQPYSFVYTQGNPTNKNFIYYKPGTNIQNLIVSLNYDTTALNPSGSTYIGLYPNFVIKNNTTGVIKTLQNTLYNENLCNTYESASANTAQIEIILGTGGTSYSFYLDPDQTTGYGYSWDTAELTGITYSNFGLGSDPLYYSASTELFYSDGSSSSSTTQTSFYIDPNSVETFSFELIGNAAGCLITNYILFESGDIFQAENGDLIEYEY